MSRILVAFDLYGTLVNPQDIDKILSQHFGKEQATSVATVWRKYQLEYTWRLNSMRKYESFSDVTRKSLLHALTEHGLKLDDSSIDGLMQAYDSLPIFPDVEPALKKLSSHASIECVVFSNGTRTMLLNSVDKSQELSPYASIFKDIITVDSVRSFKPAPEVYKYLAQCTRKVGKEDEMWLVSGNPFDIVGARAIGMQAAWVDRAGNGWQDKLGGEPTVIVKSLEEVADAVEATPRRRESKP